MTDSTGGEAFYWPVSIPVRIFVADDQVDTRQMINFLLGQYPYFKVIMSMPFKEDISMHIQVSKPQILIMDVGKLDFARMAMITLMKKKVINLVIIGLGDANSPAASKSALAAGADDVVNKSEVLQKLVPAIKRQIKEKDLKPRSAE
jgi:DNA-binding NarL/FixJ family response regulator